jgi:hypothetical protein
MVVNKNTGSDIDNLARCLTAQIHITRHPIL